MGRFGLALSEFGVCSFVGGDGALVCELVGKPRFAVGPSKLSKGPVFCHSLAISLRLPSSLVTFAFRLR